MFRATTWVVQARHLISARPSLIGLKCKSRPSFLIPVRMLKTEDFDEIEKNFLPSNTFKIERGVLYVVSTPIGNLGDITIRALRCLRGVDVIAAEDTRNTGHLMKLLLGPKDFSQRFVSHHDHNWETRIPEILRLLRLGKSVAVVSDAGTPGISDPGYELVSTCLKNGMKVVPVPGVSAGVTAISTSGQPSGIHTFMSFLPFRGGKVRQEMIRFLATIPHSIVFYEAPHRIVRTLTSLQDVEGLRNRSVTIARELTKKYEEIQMFDNMSLALQHFEKKPPKGEFTIVLGVYVTEHDEHKQKEGSALKGDVITLLNVLKQEQISPRSAAKITANVSSLKRKEVYKMYHGMVKTVDDGVFAEGRADGDSDNDALDAQSDDTETGSRYQEDEEKVRGGTT